MTRADIIPSEELWSILPSPMLMLDADGYILRSNPAAQVRFHISERGMLAALPDQIMEAHPPISDLLNHIRSGKPGVTVNDMKLRFRNAPQLECHAQVLPVDAGFLVIFQTSETPAKVQNLSSPDGVTRSVVGMADMLAHEIKNPLAGITGAAQLIEMSANEEVSELTDLIVGECQRIVKLLSQVEVFGNVLPPDGTPVNIHDVLDRAVQSASLGFAKDVKITRAYDPSLPDTKGDADKLVQVFLNLLKNAAEALTKTTSAKHNPEIHIRSFYEQGLRRSMPDGGVETLPLHVEITDNGCGIPDALLAGIFDPFVSGKQNGTGLGLALVQHIVEMHGGLIRVVSEPGQTCFSISLPLAGAGKPGQLSELNMGDK